MSERLCCVMGYISRWDRNSFRMDVRNCPYRTKSKEGLWRDSNICTHPLAKEEGDPSRPVYAQFCRPVDSDLKLLYGSGYSSKLLDKA